MKNYMVFDVGGSMIKFAVMTENGDFIEKGELPVHLQDESFQIDHQVNRQMHSWHYPERTESQIH